MLKDFLKIKKLLGRRGSGNFGSLLHGSGVDLAENRQYSPGDEKRSINRKMSAKYNELFINLFHDEKTIDVHLCCDVNYNRRGKNAELFLWFFAGLTGYFTSEKSHITGFLGEDIYLSLEKPPYQKAFIDALAGATNFSLPIYQSSLAAILKYQISIPKRRLIIIVSDFLAYGDEEKKMLDALRQKHEIRLVQIPADKKKSQNIGSISLESFQ